MAENSQRILTNQPIEAPDVVKRVRIPDALEGIIEGNTRYERYVGFVDNTLSKIWPNSPSSGEYGDDFHRPDRWDRGDISGYTSFSPTGRDMRNLTPEEFEIAVQNLGTPDYIRVRSIPKQLLDETASPLHVGGSCVLETNAMRTLADIRAYIEELSVDPQKNKEEIDRYQKLMRDFVRGMISHAPTITHISGAMLGGQDVSVHLNESDMWEERIREEFGLAVDEAHREVARVYSDINDIVTRRTKLINPGATVFTVNFNELPLAVSIKNWFDVLGIPYDPKFRIAEVMYTYVGPRQLDLLKQAVFEQSKNDQSEGKLTGEEARAAVQIMGTNFHVREKQVDHLRWGSMNLPKDVIIGRRELTIEEKEKMEDDVAYRNGVLLMQDVYGRSTQGIAATVCVGFADLPAQGNNVQHESRDVGFKFTGRPGEPEFLASVESHLNSPARLHRDNVDRHLAYLMSFTVDVNDSRNRLIASKNKLLGEVNPVSKAQGEAERKLQKLKSKIKDYESEMRNNKAIIELVSWLTGPQGKDMPEEAREAAKILKDHRVLALGKIQNKGEADRSERDKQDLELLPQIIQLLSSIEQGDGLFQPIPEKVVEILKEALVNAGKNIGVINNNMDKKDTEIKDAVQEVERLNGLLREKAPLQAEIEKIEQRIIELGRQSYFPLSDNAFVHHAMQFLWDPDFVIFLRNAVNIQEEMGSERGVVRNQIEGIQMELEAFVAADHHGPEEVKTMHAQAQQKIKLRKAKEAEIRTRYNEPMRQLMATIYPKLATYINYLYGKIDYPWEVRGQSVFSPQEQ